MTAISAPLFVGQAPSRRTDGGEPFSGATGLKLEQLLGRPLRGYPQVNLFDRWPGTTGNGDVFPLAAARDRAAAILAVFAAERIVAVGLGVGRAFGLSGGPLDVVEQDGRRFLLLPHPSGRNRWYNVSASRLAAGEALRRFVA